MYNTYYVLQHTQCLPAADDVSKIMFVISVYLFQLMVMCVCVCLWMAMAMERLWNDGDTECRAKCNHDILYFYKNVCNQPDEGAPHILALISLYLLTQPQPLSPISSYCSVQLQQNCLRE